MFVLDESPKWTPLNIGDHVPSGMSTLKTNNGCYFSRFKINTTYRYIPGKYSLLAFYSVNFDGSVFKRYSGIMEMFEMPSHFYEINYVRNNDSLMIPEGAIVGDMTSQQEPLYLVKAKISATEYGPGYFKAGDTCANAEEYGVLCVDTFYFIRFKRSKYGKMYIF